ncbi:atlastin-2-like isoform X3 [Haemaphysalis longicornis]
MHRTVRYMCTIPAFVFIPALPLPGHEFSSVAHQHPHFTAIERRRAHLGAMADHREVGRPIQILRLEDGSRFSFDFDALEEILLAGHVKNLPVVVVSIAGKFRRGKSFVLNFFLQYMRNRKQCDWMTDPNDPEQGFPWRNGSERETTGIWIWSEVFVVTTTEGRKVAVLFLDSQGTFDCESTIKRCATIFALSAMASSVLIYNLQHNLDEADLQHLQLFTQYGRLAMEVASTKSFVGLLSDIDDDFKEWLRVLVPSMLQPNMLAVKKNGDLEVTCQDLLVYLQRQVEIFNKGDLPEPRTMFEATIEANNLTAVRKAIEHYSNGMKEVLPGDEQYLDRKSLHEQHQRVEESALEVFDNVPMLGGVTYSNHHKDELKKVINELFEGFTERNKAARVVARSQQIFEEASTKAKEMLDKARAEHEQISEKARAASARANKMLKAMGLVMMTAAVPFLLPAIAGAAALAGGGAVTLAAGEVAGLAACGAAGLVAGGAVASVGRVRPLALTGGVTSSAVPPAKTKAQLPEKSRQ